MPDRLHVRRRSSVHLGRRFRSELLHPVLRQRFVRSQRLRWFMRRVRVGHVLPSRKLQARLRRRDLCEPIRRELRKLPHRLQLRDGQMRPYQRDLLSRADVRHRLGVRQRLRLRCQRRLRALPERRLLREPQLHDVRAASRFP